jgi:hypothetical protein
MLCQDTAHQAGEQHVQVVLANGAAAPLARVATQDLSAGSLRAEILAIPVAAERC